MYEIRFIDTKPYIRFTCGVGRNKEFEKRITLPLSAETLDRVDQLLAEGEPRLDMIRTAIDHEIKRRERKMKVAGAVKYQAD